MKSRAWELSLERWLRPFVESFGHKTRQKWAPVYVRGLLLEGERKSVVPVAERVAPGDAPQLHHFVAGSDWDVQPVWEVLLDKAAAMVGGPGSHLIVDDTSLPKKGRHSVGVAPQYCGALGKKANCQSLVSLTWAKSEVPVPIDLRLYLPKDWADDSMRRAKTRVPETIVFQPKWRIALDRIESVLSHVGQDAFDDVLADAGYGMVSEFRRGLTQLGLRWAVGILSTQTVYSVDVAPRAIPPKKNGRPYTFPPVDQIPVQAAEFITRLGTHAFRKLSWRNGTKGPLCARFAMVRVKVADGPELRGGVHLPGDECWLVCELRSTGERKYYLSNYPPNASRKKLAAIIKARWSCEQAHQQLKEELGLDHFEGRNWYGLHHHALLTLIAFAFLQHQRLRENKS
jgi:SRSO17 transposase